MNSNNSENQIAEAARQRERLKASLAECQAELKRAKQHIADSSAQAQAAIEELQQFVYAASHDLQQPARTVSTYAQLLQREISEGEQSREFLGFIIDSAAELNALVRDLLTYSRTGSSPRKRAVKLTSALNWALLKLADPIRDSGAHIDTEDMPEALVDDTQLAQVFEHLLSNAIKYRGTKSPHIRIDASETDDVVTVSVSDNGPGIEPKFHEHVFMPFKRLHGKEIPGSGLGLAICRKILLAHHGKIWVESDGRNGSTFRFSVPV